MRWDIAGMIANVILALAVVSVWKWVGPAWALGLTTYFVLNTQR